MEKIVIVVRKGMVESVLTSMQPHQIELELLDMDTEDWEEVRRLRKRLKEVRKIYRNDLLE